MRQNFGRRFTQIFADDLEVRSWKSASISVYLRPIQFMTGLIAWLMLAQAIAYAAPLSQSGQVYHTVLAGENLFRISLRYGTTIQALMQTNGITDPARLQAGQRLRIPSNSSSLPASSQAASGEPVAQSGTGVHVVQAGENLYRIGLRYGLAAQALALANGLPNVNVVYVGQRLVIPTAGQSAGSASSAPAAGPAPSGPYRLEVPLDAQDRPLSCEASAAGMAAAFYHPTPPQGYASWEQYFIDAIPLHNNPHRGFVGNVNSQERSVWCAGGGCPFGYGVHAEPVVQALQAAGIGLNARVAYGVDYPAVAETIKAGQPVLVWVFHPAYHKGYDPATMRRVEVDPETNQAYTLIEGEHVFVVVGLSGNEKWFLVHDPYQGRAYWVSGFNGWELFNGMRVVVERSQTHLLRSKAAPHTALLDRSRYVPPAGLSARSI